MVIKTSKGNRKRFSIYMDAGLYSRIKKMKFEKQYSMNEKYCLLLEESLKQREQLQKKF